MSKGKSAILALENGSIFHGKAFGASKTVLGEAVFNTSMTGYQEIITDPSYFGQIVTMTAPQIGNYGINDIDEESDGPKVSGFVIRQLSPISSNWRSTKTLDEYLKEHVIPGIEGVDTRAITMAVRKTGIMKACLSTEGISEKEALKKTREWPGLEGIDLAKKVTSQSIYEFEANSYCQTPFTVEGTHLYPKQEYSRIFHIVAFDYGIKRSILNKLANHGFKITVVPADTPASKIEEINPEGIFLSNGPGDPSALTYAHKTVRKLMPKYPIFGICMGHQVITHALGANTFKLKFGHRGGNQPVKNIETGKVTITAQNHGYSSNPDEIKINNAIITEINLNDGTVSGLRHKNYPVFSVQYHPEAAPGPNDATSLFQDFYKILSNNGRR